jgi:hypothetical protein
MSFFNTQNNNYKIKKQRIKTKKQRSCRTKKVYASLSEATASANKLNNQSIYVKPYECSVCKKFHLTKRSKKTILEDLFKQIEKQRV